MIHVLYVIPKVISITMVNILKYPDARIVIVDIYSPIILEISKA
jgi:hypothetical protein